MVELDDRGAKSQIQGRIGGLWMRRAAQSARSRPLVPHNQVRVLGFESESRIATNTRLRRRSMYLNK